MSFLGKNCTENVDRCLDNGACGEYGTCTDEEEGFSCSCLGAHAGRFCDESICSARNNPCLNGAECLLEGNFANFHRTSEKLVGMKCFIMLYFN